MSDTDAQVPLPDLNAAQPPVTDDIAYNEDEQASRIAADLEAVFDVPVQVSATSQAPFAARQIGPAATGEQVPTLPVRLHDEQAPVQAVLQQMPLTQVNPDAH